MSELISGKEAKLAWANGENIELCYKQHEEENTWFLLLSTDPLSIFDRDDVKFRLKPRTITINGIEVPAPFEPKEGDDCRCYYINTAFKNGFDWYHSTHHESHRVAWQTEDEIKQVASALRSVFKGE